MYCGCHPRWQQLNRTIVTKCTTMSGWWEIYNMCCHIGVKLAISYFFIFFWSVSAPALPTCTLHEALLVFRENVPRPRPVGHSLQRGYEKKKHKTNNTNTNNTTTTNNNNNNNSCNTTTPTTTNGNNSNSNNIKQNGDR